MLEPAAVAGVALLTTGFYYRSDFAHYSVFTVGRFRRLRRQSVREEGHHCRDCDTEIELGERRDYYKALVVAGAETLRYGGGTARYCYSHSDVGVRGDLEPVETFETVPWWARVFLLFGETLETEPAEKNEFENLTTGVSSAFQLTGVLVLVVVAATIVGAVNALRGST